MKQTAILAIDNGTQSVRAIAFDLQGQILAKAQIPLNDYFAAEPGWAEHDVSSFWHAACQACQQVFVSGAVSPAQIAGVAVTTQRGTVINLDQHGQPLRPAITWLDQRRCDNTPSLPWYWRSAFKLAGVSSTIRYLQQQAEVNWLAANQPELWQNTAHYLLLSGYLNYQLTGEFTDSIASQVAYLPFDYQALDWAGKWAWQWHALAIPRHVLPELRPPGALLGKVTAAAAAATGLLAGTPVLAAAADKACEVLGAGCITPERACLSFGTTATINTSRASYLEVTPYIPPYPAALPHHYNTEVQIFRGYWMVNWFKEQFGHHEQSQAAVLGVVPEDLFDDLVRSVPPGAMGLTLQPYWTPGIKIPGAEAKGAIIGFGDVHTRAHLYRAILEGLAYALRDGKERIERRSKQAITELRIAGGGSQSDAAMQLTADVFNMPTTRPALYETSALGAAMNAAVGLGLHSDYQQALQAMCRDGASFMPNPAHADIYQRLYSEVYQNMYGRLQPLYKAIQKITGYPRLD